MELGSSLSRASTVLRSTKSSEMCLQVLDSQSSLLQARFQHLCKSMAIEAVKSIYHGVIVNLFLALKNALVHVFNQMNLLLDFGQQ